MVETIFVNKLYKHTRDAQAVQNFKTVLRQSFLQAQWNGNTNFNGFFMNINSVMFLNSECCFSKVGFQYE